MWLFVYIICIYVLSGSLAFACDHLCISWCLRSSACGCNPTRCWCDTLSEKIWHGHDEEVSELELCCLRADPGSVLGRKKQGYMAMFKTRIMVVMVNNGLFGIEQYFFTHNKHFLEGAASSLKM